MGNEEKYINAANKLMAINDKFIEIEAITQILNIWIKEKDYELIPVINMLNDKINDIAKIIEK